MLSTAIAIQNATSDVIQDEYALDLARNILAGIHEGVYLNDVEQFSKDMFQYTTHIIAATATLVSAAAMGQEMFDKMVDEIQEMENITREIETE